MTINILTARDVSCGFESDLFSGLNFDLNSGEVLQILGTNGSGKTTLLKCLMGLFPLSAGNVSWFGHDLLEQAFESQVLIGERVSYQSFDLALKKQLTARENLELYLSISANELQQASPHLRHEAIDRVLSDLGLYGVANKMCQHLSSGQLRRLSLSKLILNPVDVWVLDEPFAAVDKEGVELLQRILNSHVLQGGSVLFTSHQDIILDVPITQVTI